MLAGLGFSGSGFFGCAYGSAGARLVRGPRGSALFAIASNLSRVPHFGTVVSIGVMGLVFGGRLLLKWRCIADHRTVCTSYRGLDRSRRDRQAIRLRICGKSDFLVGWSVCWPDRCLFCVLRSISIYALVRAALLVHVWTHLVVSLAYLFA